jgi:hypothetical protein
MVSAMQPDQIDQWPLRAGTCGTLVARHDILVVNIVCFASILQPGGAGPCRPQARVLGLPTV